MATPHLLVIDASLDKRIATELRYRQRPAVSLAALQMRRMEDPELLPELFVRIPDQSWVLVTADDSMPDEHAEIFARLRPTVATIRPRTDEAYNDDEWGRDVVHRWAHVIDAQEPKTVRRYWLKGHGVWKPARRKRR